MLRGNLNNLVASSPPVKNAVLRKAAAKRHRPGDAGERTLPPELLDPVRVGREHLVVLGDYIGPHKIMWATDYPHQDGFFPRTPEMIRERIAPLSPEAKHQVLAGGAMGFCGLH